ncbi:MAG TPA: hypothetical protein VM840_13545 [Actinomycetota bacterium]|nr:hypothetical protein [Actinomycetota bacterium]
MSVKQLYRMAEQVKETEPRLARDLRRIAALLDQLPGKVAYAARLRVDGDRTPPSISYRPVQHGGRPSRSLEAVELLIDAQRALEELCSRDLG